MTVWRIRATYHVNALMGRQRSSLPKNPGAGAPPSMLVSDGSPALLDAIVRLLRLLNAPHDLPALAPAGAVE
jgi:AraC-type transcriptional regulator N-terminus.